MVPEEQIYVFTHANISTQQSGCSVYVKCLLNLKIRVTYTIIKEMFIEHMLLCFRKCTTGTQAWERSRGLPSRGKRPRKHTKVWPPRGKLSREIWQRTGYLWSWDPNDRQPRKEVREALCVTHYQKLQSSPPWSYFSTIPIACGVFNNANQRKMQVCDSHTKATDQLSITAPHARSRSQAQSARHNMAHQKGNINQGRETPASATPETVTSFPLTPKFATRFWETVSRSKISCSFEG